MKYFFKIKEKTLCVENYIKSLDIKLQDIISTYPKCDEVASDDVLVIKSNKTYFKFNKKEFNIDCSITNRDLYQLFYFFVYQSFITKNTSCIHGVAVAKNQKGILILGDFGAGKTTLSLELKKIGYEILSSDTSLLKITRDKLFFSFGSAKIKLNDEISYLDFNDIDKNIIVEKIIILIGLCDNGAEKFDKIDDKVFKAKKIWKHMMWPYETYSPHLRNKLVQFISQTHYEFIKNFINTTADVYIIRGDKKLVAKKLTALISDKF